MNAQLRIVLVGEVDCGKSTLIGRLLYDTDSISTQAKQELQKTCQDLGREFEFAYLLDSFQEERQDEFTLDTTQAVLKAKNKEFLLIDVPGHRALIKNMLTGASYADAGVLVVDVKKILEEQTKRHLYILKFLGIEQLIVCINKIDLVYYEEKYFIEAKQQIEGFLKEIGLHSTYIIPVSAKEGENLLTGSSKMVWHKGLSLLEALGTVRKKEQLFFAFRLPIQDIYEIKKEQILVGTIASGKINKGDLVCVTPFRRVGACLPPACRQTGRARDKGLKVKAIKIFGKHTNTAQSGESIGLVFKNLLPELKRGQVLYKRRSPNTSSEIQAKIFCLKPLEVEQELFISCATQRVRCKISWIIEGIDTISLNINKGIDKLNSTDAAEVVITTKEPLVIERFQDLPELGRFILQKDTEISAIGIIKN